MRASFWCRFFCLFLGAASFSFGATASKPPENASRACAFIRALIRRHDKGSLNDPSWKLFSLKTIKKIEAEVEKGYKAGAFELKQEELGPSFEAFLTEKLLSMVTWVVLGKVLKCSAADAPFSYKSVSFQTAALRSLDEYPKACMEYQGKVEGGSPGYWWGVKGHLRLISQAIAPYIAHTYSTRSVVVAGFMRQEMKKHQPVELATMIANYLEAPLLDFYLDHLRVVTRQGRSGFKLVFSLREVGSVVDFFSKGGYYAENFFKAVQEMASQKRAAADIGVDKWMLKELHELLYVDEQKVSKVQALEGYLADYRIARASSSLSLKSLDPTRPQAAATLIREVLFSKECRLVAMKILVDWCQQETSNVSLKLEEGKLSVSLDGTILDYISSTERADFRDYQKKAAFFKKSTILWPLLGAIGKNRLLDVLCKEVTEHQARKGAGYCSYAMAILMPEFYCYLTAGYALERLQHRRDLTKEQRQSIGHALVSGKGSFP